MIPVVGDQPPPLLHEGIAVRIAQFELHVTKSRSRTHRAHMTIEFDDCLVVPCAGKCLCHSMNSVIEIGDLIVFLFEGKKEWEGTAEDILKTDHKELNDFIFASKLAKALKRQS